MEKKLTVTRVFDAPIEQVWQVWIDPELIKRWWGPDRFTCPSANIDFREGATSHVCMRAPKEFGGRDMYNIWTYKKIVPLESIEFIQNLADENGVKQNPVSLGMPPDFPEDLRTVVTFKKLGDNKTEMSVTEYGEMGQIAEFARIGLEQSLDKMFEIFPSAVKAS
jgi:uncharacterized protein YndB with AHSA1/START domain